MEHGAPFLIGELWRRLQLYFMPVASTWAAASTLLKATNSPLGRCSDRHRTAPRFRFGAGL